MLDRERLKAYPPKARTQAKVPTLAFNFRMDVLASEKARNEVKNTTLLTDAKKQA